MRSQGTQCHAPWSRYDAPLSLSLSLSEPRGVGWQAGRHNTQCIQPRKIMQKTQECRATLLTAPASRAGREPSLEPSSTAPPRPTGNRVQCLGTESQRVQAIINLHCASTCQTLENMFYK